MEQFLVIQTASIGDVILTTPLAEALHSSFPHVQIDILVRKGNEGLLSSHPFLHQVLTWDKDHRKYLHLLRLLVLIRERRYDYVINVQRFASSGLLTAFSKAKVRIGFGKNPFSVFFDRAVKHDIAPGGTFVHEVDRNLSLIRTIVPDGEQYPRLYPSEDDYKSTVSLKGQPYVCIAPASLWFTKQYPSKKWIEFLRVIPAEYYVYLIGSGKDKDLCDQIIKDSGHEHAETLAGRLTFLQTAAMMKDAVMNFVNDSAPQHLASAVDAPVAAIFCSTVPAFGFGPLSGRSYVIETRELLNCRPCGLHGLRKCPLDHFKCAYTIENKQLLDVFLR
ncbi:MAG: glycosyltransferase family 9 protein [Bacteroidetes bacterium]|nr:glycosyltransferase family 9 protein [Bacteroidota bacterium]